ncbi:hypothetical protein D9M69_702710 [compost metagenome]
MPGWAQALLMRFQAICIAGPPNVSCRTSCNRGPESLQPIAGPHLLCTAHAVRIKAYAMLASAQIFYFLGTLWRVKFLEKDRALSRSPAKVVAPFFDNAAGARAG